MVTHTRCSLKILPRALMVVSPVPVHLTHKLTFAGDTCDMLAFIVLPILMWLAAKLRR